MPIDLNAAEQFIYADARLLDRHRLATLLRGAPNAPVLDALRAYRNPDGGFGHALEPDVRGPRSEPASTLHALDILAEVGAVDDPMVAEAADWIAGIALPDAGIPFVLPGGDDFPHAPWMVPSPGGSFLTFALAASLWEVGAEAPWLERGTEWCWAELEGPADLGSYWLKFALAFLDRVPDEARARTALESLQPRIDPDGWVTVPEGAEGERLSPLALSPRPAARSRALFTDEQIEADLSALEAGQEDDGG
ncbi:MAG TPA: hypothetical protein VGH14_19800 [Solirubrobacterales bacterium]|jgi:hypothetical protein